jgi:hypothetical protein
MFDTGQYTPERAAFNSTTQLNTTGHIFVHVIYIFKCSTEVFKIRYTSAALKKQL